MVRLPSLTKLVAMAYGPGMTFFKDFKDLKALF